MHLPRAKGFATAGSIPAYVRQVAPVSMSDVVVHPFALDCALRATIANVDGEFLMLVVEALVDLEENKINNN